MEYKEDIRSYFDKIKSTLDKLNIEELSVAMRLIEEAYMDNANIFTMGNGGSSATASHMVCDFNKGISGGRQRKFKLICLNDNIPSVLAIANDIGYEEIFSYQLQGRLKQGDILIAISGSGNSKNIIKAVEYAKACGNKVIGLTGFEGGRLKQLSDCFMHVPANDMQITEDIHMIFDHMMMKIFNEKLGSSEGEV